MKAHPTFAAMLIQRTCAQYAHSFALCRICPVQPCSTLLIECRHRHYNHQTPLRTLVANTAAFIQSNGGAVRRMDSFGNQTLPQMIRKEGTTHSTAE